MNLIVTADDYGVTRGVTDTILLAVDSGSVNCVSIMANGDDFERAVAEAKKRPDMKVAVHFNLTDGKSSSDLIGSILVDDSGRFRMLFQKLFFTYLFSLRKKKLANDVYREVCAQISFIQKALPGRILYLNGHDHIHMIPFVFREVSRAAEHMGIAYVRISREPFFYVSNNLSVYFGSGILKHSLLNFFSFIIRSYLKQVRFSVPNFFIGTLFTGAMTTSIVRTALNTIKPLKNDTVEVLFHPGGESDRSLSRWPKNGRSDSWYFSESRRQERSEVMSQDFRSLVESFK